MCVNNQELNMYPVKTKGWFSTKTEWEGIGFKVYGHRKDGSLVPVLYSSPTTDKWLTAESPFCDRGYYAGFHIFLNKEDAIVYATGWDFSRPGIYHVRYKEVIGMGNQYLFSGTEYGRCVIAARMLICKDTMSKIGVWE